jgi:hypothetical protein
MAWPQPPSPSTEREVKSPPGPRPAPRLETVRLAQAESPSDALLGGKLEAPAEGAFVSARVCTIRGWTLTRDGRVIAVELLNGARLIQRAELGVPRPDVRDRFPRIERAGIAGFRAIVNLLGVRDEIELDVRATLSDDRQVPIGSLHLRRRQGRPDDEYAWPLVSVIIPCFNQAHYLGEAIESVLAQTHADFEIVVVDDGSDDNTFEVAQRYPGVLCARGPNRGVGAARNVGFAMSEGAFVVFLDADDRLLPKALEVGLQALERRTEAAFAAGACRDIGPDGALLLSDEQPLVHHDHYVELLRECFIWSGSSIVYRRAALEAVGGFSESRLAADDYELYLKMARRFPIACHHQVVTEYRRHGSNQTRDHGLTLASEVSVLRAQRRNLGSASERAACRTGVHRARSQHGQALAAEVRAHIGRREWSDAWRRALLLARWYPKGILSLIGVHMPVARA